jgi:hypothetical protein
MRTPSVLFSPGTLQLGTVMVALGLLLGLSGAAVAQDLDGDGWSVADGDLCDVPSGLCTSPELVNPGAYDIPGNGIDDDCDGTIDNPAPLNCSTTAQFSGVHGLELAKALDICQLTPASPPLPQRTWGLISAEVLRGSGSGLPPSALQVAVVTGFGNDLLPQANATMAVLSSGTARDADDPGYVAPAPGFSDPSNTVLPPADFTAAHGGYLVSAPGCPVVPGNQVVYDGVLLRLNIRVPTNADGLYLDLMFLTSQYPDVCTEWNDHVLALLYTGASIPADHNIAFDASSNYLTTQTATFAICADPPGCFLGSGALAGTGFDPDDDAATGWLHNVAPVIPGEEITLDLYIFDVSDALWDSTVLLDNLHWHFIPQADLSAVEGTDPTPRLRLLGPVPNPFNPQTTLRFVLPSAGQVQLAIFDIAGHRVATLVDGHLEGGEHQVIWRATDDSGRRVASGVYVARLAAGERVESVRMVVLE